MHHRHHDRHQHLRQQKDEDKEHRKTEGLEARIAERKTVRQEAHGGRIAVSLLPDRFALGYARLEPFGSRFSTMSTTLT